jgi:hypothetical protein
MHQAVKKTIFSGIEEEKEIGTGEELIKITEEEK